MATSGMDYMNRGGGGVELTTALMKASVSLPNTFTTISGVTPVEGMLITVVGTVSNTYGGALLVKNGEIVELSDSSFSYKAKGQISNGALQLRQAWSSSAQNCALIIAQP